MKLKKEYIILAFIIIALGAYLAMRSSNRTLYQLPDVPQVSQKEITKLQIAKDKTTIVLNKKDNNWYIAPDGYSTDTNKVKTMLDNLEKLTLTALVSESKNYNRYDLGAEQKINVKAWQGDNLKRDIDVGKTAPSFRHTFVKTAGDERVFHAQGNFRNTFEVTVDDLRDKTVLTLKPEEIQQIQVTKDNQSLSLTRTQPPVNVESPDAENGAAKESPAKEAAWQTADGRAADVSAINQLLQNLADLRCEKYIDDRKKDDFTSPLYNLQLKGAQEYSLSIFAKAAEKDDSYPAVSSASNYPFVLSSSQVDRLMKNPSEMVKTPDAEENKSATQKQNSAPQDQ
jgi:hypothetical protein